MLDLLAAGAGQGSPLLLLTRGETSNLDSSSRCQFYVDGESGAAVQTPI